MAVFNSDGSQANVQSIHDNSVVDGRGDVITLPGGTFTWGGTATITKSCVIQGVPLAGGVTGNNTGVASLPGAPTQAQVNACKTQWATVINSTVGSTAYCLQCVSGNNGNITVANICFNQTVDNSKTFAVTLALDRSDCINNGTSNAQLVASPYTCLVHDCFFDPGGINNYMIVCSANGMIIWNCTIVGASGVQSVCGKYYYTASWNTPDTYGTQDTTGLGNTYIENCTFGPNASTPPFGAPQYSINADDNTRFVMRFCAFNNASIGSHGQESSPFGIRAFEIYNNTFISSAGNPQNMQSMFTDRGGAGTFFNNTLQPIPGKSTFFQFLCLGSNGINNGQSPQTAYPAARQCGQGWSSSSSNTYGNPQVVPDGTGRVTTGTFIWNNTGWPAGSVQDYNNNGIQWTAVNRDYFLSAKPSYATYTYPHPLTGAPQPPGPPTLTSIITGPTPAFVQGNSFSFAPGGGGSVLSSTYNNAQVAGDTNIVIFWMPPSSSITSLVDTAGNTYALISTHPSIQVEVYIAYNIVSAAPGTNTVNATQNGIAPNNWGEMNILEYNSLINLQPPDGANLQQGTPTDTSSNCPVTTANASDLIISGWAGLYPLPGSVTAPFGFNLETTATTNPQTSYGTSFIADQQSYSAGTYNPVWTWVGGNNWTEITLGLKSTLSTPPAQATINLTWLPVPAATGYNLYYGTSNPVTVGNSTKIVLGNVTSETLSGLPSGTYYLVLTATNAAGESADSNQVSAVVGIPTINAAVPFGPGTLISLRGTMPDNKIAPIAPATVLTLKPTTIRNAIMGIGTGTSLLLQTVFNPPSLQTLFNLVPKLSIPAVATLFPQVLTSFTLHGLHNLVTNTQPGISFTPSPDQAIRATYGQVAGFSQANQIGIMATAQSSISQVFTAAQVAGNCNVVFVVATNATTVVTSISDTSLNTYNRIVAPAGPIWYTSVYVATGIAAAAANTNRVTVNFSPATDFPTLVILEYSGITVTPLDVATVSNGSGTAITAGAMATANSQDMILSLALTNATNPTFTAGPGQTMRVNMGPAWGAALEEQNVGNIGTYAPTFTLSPTGPWQCVAVALKFTLPLSPQTLLGLVRDLKHGAIGPLTPSTALTLMPSMNSTTLLNANVLPNPSAILALLSRNLHRENFSPPIATLLSLATSDIHSTVAPIALQTVLMLQPAFAGFIIANNNLSPQALVSLISNDIHSGTANAMPSMLMSLFGKNQHNPTVSGQISTLLSLLSQDKHAALVGIAAGASLLLVSSDQRSGVNAMVGGMLLSLIGRNLHRENFSPPIATLLQLVSQDKHQPTTSPALNSILNLIASAKHGAVDPLVPSVTLTIAGSKQVAGGAVQTIPGVLMTSIFRAVHSSVNAFLPGAALGLTMRLAHGAIIGINGGIGLTAVQRAIHSPFAGFNPSIGFILPASLQSPTFLPPGGATIQDVSPIANVTQM